MIAHLGLVEYETAWRLQGRLAGQIARGERPPTLLLLEHPHTYTFGRRGQAENLLWAADELARRGVSVHWVDRGGDVTYHGPGQLVGYPLLPLAPGGLLARGEAGKPRLPQADYVGYVRRLEQALSAALASLGVVSGPLAGLTGVWVLPGANLTAWPGPAQTTLPAGLQPAKIAAIGVKVDAQGVSRHGFALNVNPDMTFWSGIIGCGLKGYPTASLAELLTPLPGMDTVASAICRSFGEIFGYEMVPGRGEEIFS